MSRVQLASGLLVCAVAASAGAQSLTPAECRLIARHLPAGDVAFRPGVDARGRAVAPADLSPAPQVVPERFVVVLSVDLRRRLGLPEEVKPELPLGQLTVENGTLLLDGRPIPPDAASGLAAACAAAQR
ncbi:MAG: hypothetical protein NZ523_06565 [Elioraea sp.]|nr:hypothetical protein [Elioraea sp.]